MNRNTALTVVLALLAVVSLSVAAATLDTATTSEGGGSLGAGPNEESGIGDDASSDGDLGNEGAMLGGSADISLPCFPFLNDPLVITAVVLGVALLVGEVYRRTRSPIVSGGVLFSVGPPVVLLHALFTTCLAPPQSGESSPLPLPTNGSSLVPAASGATGLNQSGQALSTPSALLGVVLVVAVVGSVFLLFLSTGDSAEEAPEPDAEVDESSPDVAAIGRAAGDAADRIEDDAGLENEVYRAWGEMTRLLDVPRPQSSTAGEFATAAVDAGMAREDVEELTALFEDVRYGGAEATPERERRAVDALRRIESAYASVGDGDGVDADDTDASATRGDR
ncbi:DUF4129 domain-containing protein [Halogranum amylolyticum]|uniref:DUF4129 domain-containing protein n=1 Tax=Halogranum amylolyticum TaxID=660520 RepID=UPI000B7CF3CA|nr:DUF4129 domain-containing protein [Halogranum amylolyticum]